MPVNIEFQICAIIVFGVCVFVMMYSKGIKNIQNKFFILVVIFGILSTFFETGSILCDFSTGVGTAEKDFFNIGYHIFHSSTMFLVLIYAYTISGRYHTLNTGKVALIASPLAVIVCILLLNPVFHWAYRYDESGKYERGMLVSLEYVVAAIYAIIMIYMLIKYKNSINEHRANGLIAILIIAGAGVVVQMFMPHVTIELFTQSIGTMAAMLLVENEHDVFDYESSTKNKSAFFNDNITLLSANISYSILAVSFLNYKRILSAVGTTIMREVLSEISMNLHRIFRNNTVYYCNDGTFAITYFGKNRKKAVLNDADSLRDLFSQTYIYKDFGIVFATSASILSIPEDSDNVDDIIMLMDNSFVASSAPFKVLNSSELSMIKRNMDINKSVKKAIKTNSFQVHYQPIWDTRVHRIRSAEALIRMYDDDLGYVSPEEFIKLAEKNGTVDNIGEFTFETVCRDFNEYKFKELGIDFIEVNLSTVQCMKADLSETFRSIMERHSTSPDDINLEITESAAIENHEVFSKSMADLSAMGFKFSLDDYGTGYSNLEYIMDMDFSIIKIDKRILWNSSTSPAAKSILDHTISMFREGGMEIVCEGVETEDQLAHLMEMGVEYCQGYYFSKPVDVNTFVDLCRKYNDF